MEIFMNKRIILVAKTAGIVTLLTAIFFVIQAVTTESLAYRFGFIGYGGTLLIRNQRFTWYEMCFVLGVLAGAFTILARYRAYGVSKAKAIRIVAAFVISGYIGAKILYIIENWGQSISSYLSFGGLSLFGAVFGMPLCSFLFAKLFKMQRTRYTDYIIPAALALLGCVRIGCFIKGCCKGITLWFGMRPLVIPAQLIESSLDFFFMAVLLIFESKHKYEGKHYTVFFIVYGVYRFLLEMIRDTSTVLFGMSNGQILSLLCIIIGLTSIVIGGKHKCKRTQDR